MLGLSGLPIPQSSEWVSPWASGDCWVPYSTEQRVGISMRVRRTACALTAQQSESMCDLGDSPVWQHVQSMPGQDGWLCSSCHRVVWLLLGRRWVGGRGSGWLCSSHHDRAGAAQGHSQSLEFLVWDSTGPTVQTLGGRHFAAPHRHSAGYARQQPAQCGSPKQAECYRANIFAPVKRRNLGTGAKAH